MQSKLAKWAIFSVVLALLPIGFAYWQNVIRGQDVTLNAILKNGELLLVAAAIAAAAVGDLIGSSSRYPVLKIISGGGAIVIVCLASMQFADIPAAQQTATYDAALAAFTSKILFGSAIVAGASCLVLGET